MLIKTLYLFMKGVIRLLNGIFGVVNKWVTGGRKNTKTTGRKKVELGLANQRRRLRAQIQSRQAPPKFRVDRPIEWKYRNPGDLKISCTVFSTFRGRATEHGELGFVLVFVFPYMCVC